MTILVIWSITKEMTIIATVDRRQAVLDAAARSFSIFGYKATTMDKVAKEAQVGKGTIYTFFADKEELFEAIMARFIHQMKEVAEGVLDEELPFFENLHRVLLAMVRFRESHELTIQLTHEMRAMGTPAVAQALADVEQAIIGFIRKEVERAIDKGEIRPCDPEITAFIMLRLYVAFVFEWGERHGKLATEEISRLFHLYLADGLRI